MNYCPKCGTELQGKFCSNCGFNTQKEPAQVPEFLVRFGRFLKRNVFGVVCTSLLLTVTIVGIVLLTNVFRVGKVSKIELGMTGEQVEEILGEPYLKLEGMLGQVATQQNGGEVYFWYESKAEKKLKEIDELSMKENPSNADFEKVDELYNELLEMEFKFIMVNFVDGATTQVYLDVNHKYDLLDYYATAEEKTIKSLDIVGDIKYVEEWQTVDDVSTIVQRINMDSIELFRKISRRKLRAR